MSGDINVQTFSGKVNINNNLLVGTSHLFVDTVNNKVGITTTSPGANLEVNGNLHVVTDLTFGGTLTGDGSGLSNVNSDSGLWTGAGTGNVYLSTSTHNVGIGTSSPSAKLDIDLDNITSDSIFLNMHARYENANNGYLEFLETNHTPSENTWLGWGTRIQKVVDVTRQGYIEFNPVGDGYDIAFGNDGGGGPGEIMRIDGINGNVGIGKTSPSCKLDVEGDIRSPSLEAQLTLTGGGDVTWSGTHVKWTNRVIILPIDNAYGPSGHINIPCPTSGTVKYYHANGGESTVTCTNSGIPLDHWESVYYVITYGQSHGSSTTAINSNFIVTSHVNSNFKPRSNWILICTRNSDHNSLLWKPGQINITKGGVYSSTGGYVVKQETYQTYGAATATSTGEWRAITINYDGIAHVNFHTLFRPATMRSSSTTTAIYMGLRRNSTEITDPVLGYRWATGSNSDTDRWRPITLSWSGKVYDGDSIKVWIASNESSNAAFNTGSFSVLVV